MMKEEKGNIEQMSERLFHYLRKRERFRFPRSRRRGNGAKSVSQIDKKKHIPVYRWLIPVTGCCCCFSPVCILAE